MKGFKHKTSIKTLISLKDTGGTFLTFLIFLIGAYVIETAIVFLLLSQGA